MLFTFDTNVKDYIAANSGNPEVIAAVDALAYGRRRGNHLIFADRDTLEVLANMEGISLNAKSVYTRIYSKVSTKLSLFDYTDTYIKICLPHTQISIVTDATHKIINIPLTMLSTSEISSQTKLLVENIDECKLYEFFGKIYIEENRINGVVINYEAEHGGGNDIWRVYSNIQENENKLCLTIADTDKKYPSAPLGNTAAQLASTDKADKPMTNAYILDVHEVENLFPTSIYEEMAANDGQKLDCVEGMKKLSSITNCSPLKHFDIKKGLKVGEIEKNQDTDFTAYWNTVCNTANINVICCNSNSCQGIPKRCCNYLIREWGGTAFKDLLQFIYQHGTAILQRIDFNVKQVWLHIGKVIYSWCCSGSPIRT